MHKSLLALLLLASLVVAQQSRKFDDPLRTGGKAGEEWLTYGLTPGETRYSPLDQINAGNVKRLGLEWTFDLKSGGGNQEATPLMWNGTLYAITNWSVVVAVDVKTGKERWRWDPEVNQVAVRPKICCGVVNRGLAFHNGKIIAPVIDGRLVALNAASGKPEWEARVSYAQENYTVTMAPRIAKGKVVIGVAGAEYPVRGFFAAFDAETGKQAWKFYTVPGDPSKGFESAAMKKAAETWSGEWWKLGGGATVWDGMAYDPESELLYVGTGNGGPWPEELRGSKGKDNLYACSVVAVKIDTGELKWYFQMVPGDSWDFDSVQHLLLADINVKGKQRKVLMQANKNGFYYVIDRISGQFISGQPYAQVTWARGLNEETGRPIVNPEAHYGDDFVTIQPGPGGAHNWAPMSFNPATGLVYVPTSTFTSSTYAIDRNFKYTDGKSNTGILRPQNQAKGGQPVPAELANANTAKQQKEPLKLPSIGPEPPAEGPRGVLVAWDPITQKERWRAPGGGNIGGGTVSTAGNLVLQVINDGRLFAYTADKGEKLLEVQTNLKGGMGPPITYLLDGKQYVSFMGGTGVLSLNPNAANFNPPAPGTPAPPAPRLLTFVLDGKAPLPAAQ
jgi:quinohemoprotein ethanol dehydrogenase